MRFLRIALVLSLAAIWAAPVMAQYGMYGSPELLRLSADPPAPSMQPMMQPAMQPANKPWSINQTASVAAMAQNPVPAPQPALPTPNSMLDIQPASPVAPDQSGGCGLGGCQDGCGQVSPVFGEFCRNRICPWYGSVLVLSMGRDNANKLWTSFEDGNEPNQIMNSQFQMAWRWGGEVRFGYRFCDCCNPCGGSWALEAAYWTLDAFEGAASCTNPHTVSTPIQTTEVEFNGVTADDWFDGAAEHRLTRRDEFHSVEINAVRDRFFRGNGTPWSVDWFGGVRFFRFEEEFTFASLQDGFAWGSGGGSHEVHLRDQITNNLWGFQFGFGAQYYLLSNLRLHATPKLGIYNNHIEHYFQLNLGNGTNATTGGSGVPGTYPVWSQTDKLSFLAQIDVGMDWLLTERLGLRVGYRVVAATGVGLSDNQIPPYLVDIPAIADIDTNGELILHGAYIGLTYNF
jgi:hypothetical protein